MARRSGQNGYIEKKGKNYHVRYRIDIPGQEKRAYKSVPICPVSGPGKMTKPERERRAKEIIAESGADTEQHFKQVEAVNSCTTFRQQAERWLIDSRNRKRDPAHPNTIAGWRSHLDTWLLPEFGDMPLACIDNSEGKVLVDRICKEEKSANTIRCVLNVMKWVVASAVDSKGNQLYPRSWNHDFMDVPLVKVEKLRRPTLTAEEVSKIIRAAWGRERMRYVCSSLLAVFAWVGKQLLICNTSSTEAARSKFSTAYGVTISVRQSATRSGTLTSVPRSRPC